MSPRRRGGQDDSPNPFVQTLEFKPKSRVGKVVSKPSNQEPMEFANQVGLTMASADFSSPVPPGCPCGSPILSTEPEISRGKKCEVRRAFFSRTRRICRQLPPWRS
jgi:hypothetical protein